jgi:hypothetical protein
MGGRGARRTSWTAAVLLATAWASFNAASLLPVVAGMSAQRWFRMSPIDLPGWLLPVLSGWAGTAILAALLLIREPSRPLVRPSWWHTRYLLAAGLVAAGYGGILLLASATAAAGPDAFLPPWAAGGDRFGARLFLSTAAFALAAWFLRRRGSRFAGTATAAANLVLGAWVPAGGLSLLWWLRDVRPAEEGGDPAQ